MHGRSDGHSIRERVAARVGSDTVFFLTGGLARCTGRGEIVEPLPQRGVRHVVLVLPESPCATADVYRTLEIAPPARSPAPLVSALAAGGTLAVGAAESRPFNRLAGAAERAYPALAERRARLTALAGRAPILSGSGGTYYFLCSSQYEARRLAATLASTSPPLDVRRAASYRAAGSRE
jgi:4-diphosphocytidyl-2-C-methyl-D-erythritol kinase